MTVKVCFAAACVLGLSVVGSGLDAQVSAPLVQSNNLVRLGSFKVPTGLHVGSGDAELEYGGTALGFNPARNSLFITGHDWDQLNEEISIPTLGGTATRLQSLTDPFEGHVDDIGASGNKTGGHFVYNGKLYVTAYTYYDASFSQKRSHFVRPVDLSVKGQIAGPYSVGPLNPGFYSGYMTVIPSAWRAALGGPVITGNCCLSIITRTSLGPAAFVIDPETLGTSAAIPLVYYNADHPTLGVYSSDGINPAYNRATQITGVVFPEGTSTVLFFGSTGLGESCYGEGTNNQALHHTPVPGYPDVQYCYDPVGAGGKGDHGYPYASYIWAYDARDFAAVKAGTKQPWQVTPYTTWTLPLSDTGYNRLGGATYDPATNRIYVSQLRGDEARPLIQVYTVSNATTTPPQAPTNVRIIR